MSETGVLWATGAMSVAAIMAAPLITLWVQVRVEQRNALKEGREAIFKALWLNRRRPFYIARIDALNMVDVEFYGKEKVQNAWVALRADYFDKDASQQADSILLSRRDEKFAALLYEMAQVLGYKFDLQHIKDNVYLPQMHVDMVDLDMETRRRVVDLLRSDALPVRFVDGATPTPSVAEPVASPSPEVG